MKPTIIVLLCTSVSMAIQFSNITTVILFEFITLQVHILDWACICLFLRVCQLQIIDSLAPRIRVNKKKIIQACDLLPYTG